MRAFSTRAAGLLVLLGGLWGGLAPFVGPYWHFTLGPDRTWTWTTGRLWLDLIPGAVAVVAGLMLMKAGPRPHARLGALLGLAAGIWFTVGPAISELWTMGGAQGAGHGAAHTRMLENLTFHTGLGVLMAAIAAYVLPRFPRALAAERTAGAGGAAYAERDTDADRDTYVDRDMDQGTSAQRSGRGRMADERNAAFDRSAGDRSSSLDHGIGEEGATHAMPTYGDGAARHDDGAGTLAHEDADAGADAPVGGTIADRRQGVRRRRGGLFGILTRR